MAGVHLAQLNVGRLRAPLDDPAIGDFRRNLGPVNALAEVSPGYVWRLQDDAGDATGIKPFDDDLEIVNLTVWESIEALADFTYRSGHVEFLRRRRDFFETPTQPILCLCGSPKGPSRRSRRPSPGSSISGPTVPRPPPSRSATASAPATTRPSWATPATAAPPRAGGQ